MKTQTKSTRTTRTTKASKTADTKLTYEIVREYLALPPHARRAAEVALVCVEQGMPKKLIEPLILRLADMWRAIDDEAAERAAVAQNRTVAPLL